MRLVPVHEGEMWTGKDDCVFIHYITSQNIGSQTRVWCVRCDCLTWLILLLAGGRRWAGMTQRLSGSLAVECLYTGREKSSHSAAIAVMQGDVRLTFSTHTH